MRWTPRLPANRRFEDAFELLQNLFRVHRQPPRFALAVFSDFARCVEFVPLFASRSNSVCGMRVLLPIFTARSEPSFSNPSSFLSEIPNKSAESGLGCSIRSIFTPYEMN